VGRIFVRAVFEVYFKQPESSYQTKLTAPIKQIAKFAGVKSLDKLISRGDIS
jgi:hypothetical protein